MGRRNNSFARKEKEEGEDDASAMKIRRVSADYTTRRASRVVLSRQLYVAGKFRRVCRVLTYFRKDCPSSIDDT